jgi:integrase
MATRLFSEDQMERLQSFPDIGGDELIRFFTLTPADVAFVDPGRGRGPVDRLGLAVQLCTLPWLGFVPDEVRGAPPVVVSRLAGRLGIDPGALARYGERQQTRTDHLRLVTDYLSWKTAPTGGMVMKELEQFLIGRAMEHDSPSTLFNLACEYLIATRTVRPGVVTLTQMVATARTTATVLTYEKVAHLLTRPLTADLDLLLKVDAGLGMTRLTWLTTPAVEASSTAVKAAIDKLTWVRAVDGHTLDLSMLAAERRRFLATVGRRSTNQALERREDQRRYPILLTLVAQSAAGLLDEVVALSGQAVSARESRAKAKTDQALAERGKRGEARQALLEMILPALADPGIPDEQAGGLLRTQIGMGRLREAAAVGWPALPRDHGRLSQMNTSYNYLRQFAPNVLAAVDFQGGPGTAELMRAVALLQELNRTGARKVSTSAPDEFVPARYRDYLARARRDGDDTAFSQIMANLHLLGTPVDDGGAGDEQVMRIMMLVARTGRRISEIRMLDRNPLFPVDRLTRPEENDADDGAFVAKLHYQQTKIEQAPDTMLVDVELVAIIREQQQWADTHLAPRWAPGMVPKYLFLAHKMNRHADKAFTVERIHQTLAEFARRPDIRDSAGRLVDFNRTHRFRHTKATSLLNAGVPLHVAQRYMGHLTPAMTMEYAETLAETHEAEFLRHRKVTADARELEVDARDLYDMLELDKRTGRFCPTGGACCRPGRSATRGTPA